MSDGETPDSAIDSMLEESNESDHDTGQSGGIVEEISPNKGSTKGGDKFHIILRDIVPLDIDSCVACFQNCGTVHLKQTNPFTLTGSTPSSKGPGLVNVTLMSVDGSWTGGKTKFLYADLFTKEELLNQLVMDTDMQSKMFHWMYKGMSYPSDLQTSNPSAKALPGSSGVDQSTHARSVRVLQFLVYKAAQIGGHEFIQMIFRTSAGKVVFNNYKNSATLPEDVARTNGHKIVADHLQDVNNRLSEESNSDAGTETINWLELKRAVDKEQSLPCTDDAQMLKNCQPSSPESDYNGSDYLADDEMSACSSPSHSEVSDTEHEDRSQNTIKSWSEKEVNEEDNLPVENDDSSLFPWHLVANQLEFIPSMKAENDGYEHKQLDSDEVKSHIGEDDNLTDQNELNGIAVPCGSEVENWDTLRTTSSHTAALPNISSHQETDVVATNSSEIGLDGDQKEFKMIDNDKTTRSRGNLNETPCDITVIRNVEPKFSKTIETVYRSLKKVNEEDLLVENDDSSLFPLHLVGKQVEVITSIKAENAAYEQKQLDSGEVESHSNEDDMNENEFECASFKTDQNGLNLIAVPCGSEVVNWDTLRSEEIFTIKKASTGTTSSHTAALPSCPICLERDPLVTRSISIGGEQKEFKKKDRSRAISNHVKHLRLPIWYPERRLDDFKNEWNSDEEALDEIKATTSDLEGLRKLREHRKGWNRTEEALEMIKAATSELRKGWNSQEELLDGSKAVESNFERMCLKHEERRERRRFKEGRSVARKVSRNVIVFCPGTSSEKGSLYDEHPSNKVKVALSASKVRPTLKNCWKRTIIGPRSENFKF